MARPRSIERSQSALPTGLQDGPMELDALRWPCGHRDCTRKENAALGSIVLGLGTWGVTSERSISSFMGMLR